MAAGSVCRSERTVRSQRALAAEAKRPPGARALFGREGHSDGEARLGTGHGELEFAEGVARAVAGKEGVLVDPSSCSLCVGAAAARGLGAAGHSAVLSRVSANEVKSMN